ncbi:MAG: hypothetical protein M3362_16925, partial [Acidobacteriota bacterium]|nr:hypothetical protein [Acidobacteriota bacterium]
MAEMTKTEQNLTYATPREAAPYQQRAALVGGVFLLLFIIGAFLPANVGGGLDQFFHSYLVGFMFWLGVTMGCLGLLMLQHLTGGAWGLVIRRVLESGTRTIPLMLVLFVPILLGMHSLYEWTHQD